MYNGMINVRKEAGYTSHDVVAKLRGILHQKKIGHTGTLDPDAVGVLPVCLGNATKLCDMFADHDKEYLAVLKLGVTTDTQDATGEILREKEIPEDQEKIVKVIKSFEGNYQQIPPMYSALKVNGQKLYDLARKGIEIEREARSVEIHAIEIENIKLPLITIRVSCSKGTYIRTLCHDIGEKLKCGGIMESLIRTRVGRFSYEDSHTLEEIKVMFQNEEWTNYLIPTENFFKDDHVLKVKMGCQQNLVNGNRLSANQLEGAELVEKEIRVYGRDGLFYGVYSYDNLQKDYKPYKMFLPEKLPMKIIEGTTKFELEEKSAIVIGKFDGIHVGHGQLLDAVISRKRDGMKAVVFTFNPSPTEFFSGKKSKELTDMYEKRKLFEKAGVDILIEYPLTKESASIDPAKFVEDILVKQMKAACICAGPDLSFGDKGKGDTILIKNMAEKFGYETDIIEKISFHGKEVSSTYVREEVSCGAMENVSALLGRNYSVSGLVVHGNQLGRTFQMPTANILSDSNKLLPPKGVYYSLVHIRTGKFKGTTLKGITNIGDKPTIKGENPVMGIETFLFEFDEDIYGETIMVELLHYKRAEVKFKNVEELIKQLKIDREDAERFSY